MLDFINNLTWPGAFAVVGSLVTIITGIFGYLIATHRLKRFPGFQHPQSVNDYEKLHARISAIVDRVAVNEGDLKEVRVSIRNLQKGIADHEQRDIQDFNLVESKLDRLMDIVVKILQDDKL